MARYTADTKDRVRDAVDMIDLVSGHTELRRAGANSYQGLCPFHEERTPSFGIDPVKKLYHCFGCGAGGDAFTFVQETQGLDFGAALETLAERYGVELEREDEDPRAAERRRRRERLYALLERVADYYARYLWDAREAQDAREYLAGRGLEPEVLRRFRVGYAPSAWDHVYVRVREAGFADEELLAAGLAQRSRQRGTLYDRFRGRLTFPLCDLRGRVLGFGARALRDNQQPKYLNTAEGELYHKGRQLFGAHLARAEASRSRSAVVVEGYTDVLALHQGGIETAVGLMGTALTEQQVGELGRLVGPDGVVHLALDPDASGQEAMLRAAELAVARDLRVDVVPLPDEGDPADLVMREGADAVRARMQQAVPLATFRVERVLARADLDSTDGRNRAFEALRAVLGAMPPTPEREDLVRLAAGRLRLSEKLAGLLTVAPPAPSAVRETPRPAEPRAVLDRREETERTFLALCMALPEPGREALRRVDLEAHFTSPLLRRAATHLRDHLAEPTAGIGPEDGELAALVAELALRAAREPADVDTLEAQTHQLDVARLERAIAAARAEEPEQVSTLAAEQAQAKERRDTAIDRAMEARPGG